MYSVRCGKLLQCLYLSIVIYYCTLSQTYWGFCSSIYSGGDTETYSDPTYNIWINRLRIGGLPVLRQLLPFIGSALFWVSLLPHLVELIPCIEAESLPQQPRFNSSHLLAACHLPCLPCLSSAATIKYKQKYQCILQRSVLACLVLSVACWYDGTCFNVSIYGAIMQVMSWAPPRFCWWVPVGSQALTTVLLENMSTVTCFRLKSYVNHIYSESTSKKPTFIYNHETWSVKLSVFTTKSHNPFWKMPQFQSIASYL